MCVLVCATFNLSVSITVTVVAHKTLEVRYNVVYNYALKPARGEASVGTWQMGIMHIKILLHSLGLCYN